MGAFLLCLPDGGHITMREVLFFYYLPLNRPVQDLFRCLPRKKYSVGMLATFLQTGVAAP